MSVQNGNKTVQKKTVSAKISPGTSRKSKNQTIKAPSGIPQKQRWNTFFGIMWMLMWVGASVIASQLIVGWLMVWILGADRFGQPVPMAVFSALSYILAMVIIIWLPSSWSKSQNAKKDGKTKHNKREVKPVNREELGLKGLPTWTDIGLAPVGFVVYLLLAAGLTALFSQFAWFDAGEAQDVGFSYSVIGFDRVLAFITLVVVAPIAEEIIFRGWLYGKLREKLSPEISEKAGVVIATLLVSLLFGLVHGQWNVGVNVFAMSLVLCALREITGTIYAGILLHMLKNGVAFYLLFVAGFGT